MEGARKGYSGMASNLHLNTPALWYAWLWIGFLVDIFLNMGVGALSDMMYLYVPVFCLFRYHIRESDSRPQLVKVLFRCVLF